MTPYELASCMKDIMIFLRDASYSGQIGVNDLNLEHPYSQKVIKKSMESLLANNYASGSIYEGNNESICLLDGLTPKGHNFLKG